MLSCQDLCSKWKSNCRHSIQDPFDCCSWLGVVDVEEGGTYRMVSVSSKLKCSTTWSSKSSWVTVPGNEASHIGQVCNRNKILVLKWRLEFIGDFPWFGWLSKEYFEPNVKYNIFKPFCTHQKWLFHVWFQCYSRITYLFMKLCCTALERSVNPVHDIKTKHNAAGFW